MAAVGYIMLFGHGQVMAMAHHNPTINNTISSVCCISAIYNLNGNVFIVEHYTWYQVSVKRVK